MNINHYEYVIKIAKTKNFSKAAELLFISQPALSQCISRLEKKLGVQLFERDTINVSITEAGKIFIDDAKKILEINNDLLVKMQKLSNKPLNQITIGISQFYGKYFIPKIIPIFKNYMPSTNINIKESESSILEENLLQEIIDLAIFPVPVQSKQILYEPFYKEKILLAANSSNNILKHFQPDSKSIDLGLFKDESFVLLKKGLKLRSLAEKICSDSSFSPKVVFETENLDILNSLVHNNMGVSLLPDVITRLSDVSYYDIQNEGHIREIIIACKKNKSDKYHIKKLAKEFRRIFAS